VNEDDFDDDYGPGDYNTDDLADAYQAGVQSYNANQNQQFGMGSEDDFYTGNAKDFTIGKDPSNVTNFIGPLSGSNNVPNVFDLGGGAGDFGFGNTRSQNFLNPQLAEMYKQQEIARTGVNLDKNPFVDSIFTDLFGDSIDRRRDLGSQRIQEINDLRARQAFGLPSLTQKDRFGKPKSYTSNDFELGRDTNQGMVKELPMGGIESFMRATTPYSFMMPTKAAPEQSQMFRDAQTEANEPGIVDRVVTNFMDFFNKDGKAQAGKTIDDIISDDRENEPISDSTDNITNPYFNPITSPTIKKEDVLNKTFMDADNTSVNQNKDGYDLSEQGIENLKNRMTERAKKYAPGGEFNIELTRRENLPRPPQLVSELQRDIAKRRGLFSLPEASGLDNNVISAGESRGKELSDFTPFPIPDVDRSGDIGDNLLAKGIREPGDDYVKYKDGSIDFFPSYIPGLETNNFKRSKADELYDKNEADRQRTARETRAALNKSIDIRGKPFENILEQKAADLEKRMIAFYNKNAPISDNTPEAKIGDAFAEEERVLRNLMDQQRKSGENLPFTAQNVNLVPNRITGEGFVLENKAGMGQDITREDINELMNLGYNETEAIEILNQQQYSEKIGLRFEDLPPDLKQQYFLNTNLDYGRSDQKPFNVVY